MPTIQISGLPASGALVDADITHVKQGTVDKKATVAQIKTAVAVPLQEEGSTVTAQPTAINFIGENVTVTDNAGVAEVTVIAPGGGGEDNLIINGNFDIWQRGVSFTPAFGGYTADRWQVSGTGATHTRQSHLLGQTEVPGEPEYFLRTTSSTAGLDQPIEGLRSTAGRQIVLSFYARAASAVTLNSTGFQVFGSGGSANVTISVASGSSAVHVVSVGSFTKHTVVFDVAGLSGKTIGEGSNLLMRVFPTSVPNNLDISQVKVEVGSGATPYVPRHQQQELSLCQRYYQKTYELAVFPGDTSENKEGAFFGTPVTGDTTIGSYHGPVRMRATPTATFYSARVGGTSGTFWDVLSNTDRAVVSVATGETGTGINLTAGIPSTTTIGGHIVLDAEL